MLGRPARAVRGALRSASRHPSENLDDGLDPPGVRCGADRRRTPPPGGPNVSASTARPAPYPVTLDGQAVLVAGGAGAVGEGIVRGLLAAGAAVVVPSREQSRLDALRERLPGDALDRFTPVVGNVGTIKGADALRDQLVALGRRVDHAVASLGGWSVGAPLAELQIGDWRRVLDDNLTAHFVAARTFLPLVAAREGGSYTFITGPAGETPVANAGPLSVAVAGQLMLKRAFAQEFRHTGVRVNEVMVYSPVTRDRPVAAGPGTITAEEIGEFVAFLASPHAHASPETIRLPDRGARDAALAWLRV
jgi:3-oxoacyl-[acyl-carrier protein] reductase